MTLPASTFKSLLFVLLTMTLLASCSSAPPPAPPQPPPSKPTQADPIGQLLPVTEPAPEDDTANEGPPLEKMGFSTQVGAFANLDNAVRLEQALDKKGIDAYYFRHESGLYKVRFGNHGNYQSARSEAEQLQSQGLIDNFFTVIPDSYTAARIQKTGKGDLRTELVNTTRRFLGVPYRWGGENSNGFDCSGLTMVSYRLNGLNLPRNSRMQFKAGRWVPKAKLQKGDLVFFATKGGTRVTHVGMYAGRGQFIHAPRTGKTVRYADLSNSFWKKTYMGGRSYL